MKKQFLAFVMLLSTGYACAADNGKEGNISHILFNLMVNMNADITGAHRVTTKNEEGVLMTDTIVVYANKEEMKDWKDYEEGKVDIVLTTDERGWKVVPKQKTFKAEEVWKKNNSQK